MTPEVAAESELLTAFFKQFPFFQIFGMEPLEFAPGRSVLRIAFRDDLTQPAGVMHGGVIATIADTGMAHAVLLTDMYRSLRSRGGSIVSVDLRVKYLRPVSGGSITAISTAPKIGNRIIHTESLVVNDAGKEVARADAIFMAVEGKQLQAKDSGP